MVTGHIPQIYNFFHQTYFYIILYYTLKKVSKCNWSLAADPFLTEICRVRIAQNAQHIFTRATLSLENQSSSRGTLHWVLFVLTNINFFWLRSIFVKRKTEGRRFVVTGSAKMLQQQLQQPLVFIILATGIACNVSAAEGWLTIGCTAVTRLMSTEKLFLLVLWHWELNVGIFRRHKKW